ncbi:MAG: hypothetical protein WD894_02930 [Pirellulales bacterium]
MSKLQYFLVSALLLIANRVQAVEPSFTPLPDLPDGRVVIDALSANGEVAVGPGFRWTREAGIAAFSGIATDVSADDAVVVGYREAARPSSGIEAFRWTAETGFIILDHLGAFNQSYAWGVSADGGMVVGESGISSVAVRWSTDGRVTPLVTGHAQAIAASADGSIVAGNAISDLYSEAFRWSDGRNTLLGTLSGDLESLARDMTPDG